MIESTFGAKLVAWLVGLVPALLGSAISLTIPSDAPKPTTWLDYLRVASTFASGVVIAQVSGNFIMEHWPTITSDSATIFAIKFAIGLFGMRSATVFYIQIPAYSEAIRKKLTGN